ncbi:MAG TPA: ABC transporter substrate-binding protein [Stellaceae bacterium]|nr:ABC transporter substrate-binding protein [Stellaceae bacterium]
MKHRAKAGRPLAAILFFLAAVALVSAGAAAQAADKTIRFIAQADLRSLDPIWTTAYITRNYGYMIYDTLFAVDKDLKPQPQMVDKWTESPDKLTYTFTLRPGLKWHDGTPVTGADCIASIARWGKRDALGQKLMEAVDKMSAEGESFTIALKAPFPLLIEGLAKLSSNTPFMMPERIAKTDAFTQITESIGSGPFKFVREEWVPGNKAVFVKNTDYVPRQEPPSFAAGGKVVKVDRVEWLYIPDAATAAAALNAGEADWYEQPPADLLPLFRANKDIVVANVDPLGSQGILRFNSLQPPFNNVKMRQAVMALVNQKDYMRAVAGSDEKLWRVCVAMFVCGTPLATDAGGEQLLKGPDLAKAKELIKEAGYKGEKIALISATDQPIVHNQALVTAEALKNAGLNVELQANDWGTLITRRAGKAPVEKGGWSIFHTWIVAPDLLSPAVNFPVRANGDGAWFGWPKDDEIEKLRDEWFKAPDLAEQKRLAAEIQKRAYEIASYVPTGQFLIPTAYRKSLTGIIPAPVVFLWNVEKHAGG